MSQLANFAAIYLNRLHMPSIRWTDVVEIVIISFLVYQIILWIKNTRAWSLLRGIVVIMAFILVAALFNMTTILEPCGNCHRGCTSARTAPGIGAVGQNQFFCVVVSF